MNHLTTFNESWRLQSVKDTVMGIFDIEVETDRGFMIYSGGAWRSELVFSIQKEEQALVDFFMVKPFKLGELEEFIARLFRWADIGPCSMVLSYGDNVSFTIIESGDLAGLTEKTVNKLIIRLSVFE